MENKIDIVHSNFIRADNFAVKTKTKKVITIRNNPDFAYSVYFGKLIGKIVAKIHFNILKKADKVVTCSRSVSQILEKTNNIKYDYITNSIDTNKITYTSFSENLKNKKELSLSDKGKIFITVDSSISGKNVETIVESFPEMEFDRFLLVSGWSLLKNNYSNRKNISFVGKVQNFFQYLSASDFFISASLSEGMPNAVLEAMATGLPVILSDIPPHREIVEGTVFENYLFEPKNVEELKEKIEKIIKEDYAQLSRTSRKIMEDNFDARKMAEKYMDVYEEILKS
jgi:glycosyltransferase involved in cell wall biosynthesis